MKKKILVAMPQRLLEQIDLLAEYRSQTRSELIREALRLHLDSARSSGAPLPKVSMMLVPQSQSEVLN